MKKLTKMVIAVSAIVSVVCMMGCQTVDLGSVSVEDVSIIESEGAKVVPAENGFPSIAIKVKVDIEELAKDTPILENLPINEGWLVLNADIIKVPTNAPVSTNSVPVD